MASKGIDRLLRWYPAAWRQRYGDELVVLMEDEFGSAVPWRARLSVVVGGVRERAHGGGLMGDSAPPSNRIVAASLVVLGAWTGFVLAGASFAKLSEHFDEALPHEAVTHRVPDAAYTTVQMAAAVAGLLVVAGASLAVPAFVRLVRDGGWTSVRRHVHRAAATTVALFLVTVPLLVWAHRLTDHDRNGGLRGYEVLFVFWAALVALTLVLWTAAATAAARRVAFTPSVLRVEAVLAMVVATSMVVMLAATSVWWVAVAQRAPSVLRGPGWFSSVRMTSTVAVMALAVSVAITGAIRVGHTWRRLPVD